MARKHTAEMESILKRYELETAAYRAVFDSIPDFVYCKDINLKYTKCNKRMEDFFGVREADLIGKDDAEGLGMPPETARLCYESDRKLLNEGRMIVSEEYMLSADGTSILFETIKEPIYQDGVLVGLTGISRDITRHKEAEDAAQAASRAKSDFLSHMSHEIRSPLNAVIGMISIGLSTDDAEKKDYCFKRADNASKHLLGVINDILDMSKIEADKFELSNSEFDFEQMLKNVTDVANVRAEGKRHEFVVELSDDVPAFIESDELRLTQVINNLLANAIKFTPENGSVVLKIDKVGERGDKLTLKFEVADTGIGISKEQQERLFASFSQADANIARKFGGTGLGLAISKRIVGLLGGNIWVESELGHGSRFIFTVKVKKLAAKPHTKLASSIKVKEIHILAVDNSAEVRELLIHLTRALNLSCHVAVNGVEALELIKNAGDAPYNLFIIDRYMPEMDGLELSRAIRESNSISPIIMMASLTDWNLVENDAFAAGVNHYIPKPVFPSTLIDAINKCIVGAEEKESVNIPQGKPMERRYDFSGYSLLIAEDVEINREIMSAILEETKISIDFAENGKVAVSMFRASPDKYNLILMDINMPEMDGYEATRTIRALDLEKAKTIPIVAMTANVFKEDIDMCLLSGMNDHTGKPVDSDALFGMLKRYLTRPEETGRMKNVFELDSGIAWNDGMLLGNALVDMQHQRLFKKLSEIVKACEDGSDTTMLQDTLEYLMNFTIRHFTDEEALQLEYGYPDYENHKRMHQAFKKIVVELVRGFNEHGQSDELSRDVNRIIVRWLVAHIQHEDKKIGEHIRKVEKRRIT